MFRARKLRNYEGRKEVLHDVMSRWRNSRWMVTRMIGQPSEKRSQHNSKGKRSKALR